MKRIAATFLALATCALPACDEDNPPTGEERGPCYPNGTCNEGLLCASDLCVDPNGNATEAGGEEGGGEEGDEEGDEEGEGGFDPDPRPGDTCTAQLLACSDLDDVECLYGYIQCREEEGVDGCDSFYNGCDLVGWDHAGCEMGSEVETQYCGGAGDTTTGSDSTSTTGSDGDSNGDDPGGDECPAPGCSSYASKMDSCTTLDVDWYAECVNTYDICGAWECIPGTAAHVACVNSSSCEEIGDGACNMDWC